MYLQVLISQSIKLSQKCKTNRISSTKIHRQHFSIIIWVGFINCYLGSWTKWSSQVLPTELFSSDWLLSHSCSLPSSPDLLLFWNFEKKLHIWNRFGMQKPHLVILGGNCWSNDKHDTAANFTYLYSAHKQGKIPVRKTKDTAMILPILFNQEKETSFRLNNLLCLMHLKPQVIFKFDSMLTQTKN